MQHAKLVVVQSYGNRIEADLAKGALEDAGIRAMIQADMAEECVNTLLWSGAQPEGRVGRSAPSRSTSPSQLTSLE